MTATHGKRTSPVSTVLVVMIASAACDAGDGVDAGSEPWSCAGEEVWEDPATGLCWMREDGKLFFSNNDYTRFMNWFDAAAVCSSLGWGEYDDWRLPTIQELIGLISGCPSTDCPVHDPDCLEGGCNDGSECEPCDTAEGIGEGGCYWPAEMGDCSWYWSSSNLEGYEYIAWYVHFSDGSTKNANKHNNHRQVRCVRGKDE